MTKSDAFLFTDIEGSTRLWQDHPEAMAEALALHDAALHDAVESAGGTVIREVSVRCIRYVDRHAEADSVDGLAHDGMCIG